MTEHCIVLEGSCSGSFTDLFFHLKVSQASRENHRRGDQLAAEQTDAHQHHGGEHRGDRAGLRQHSAPGLLQGHGEHQQHVEEPGPRNRENEPGSVILLFS